MVALANTVTILENSVVFWVNAIVFQVRNVKRVLFPSAPIALVNMMCLKDVKR